MVSKLSYMGYALRRIALKTAVSSCLGLFFFFYLQYSETGKFPVLTQNLSGLLLSILLTCLTGYSVYYMNFFLNWLVPWKSMFAGRFSAVTEGLGLLENGLHPKISPATRVAFAIASVL